MIRTKKAGSRRRRVAVAGALAAGAVMAFGASSANAATQTFSATFDDAALNLPVLGTSDILNPPPPATMTGTVDDTNGNFTVPAVGFVFPPFSGTANGLQVNVAFSAIDPIVGNIDKTTGVWTTTASNYQAVVTVPALSANCTYTLTGKVFSTGAGSPFNGDPFTVDTTTDWVPTAGILQTGWASIPPGTGSCGTTDGIVGSGPGGLEMGNGFDLTPDVATPPDTGGGGTTPPPAKKKKCKKAKKGSASASKKSKCKKKK